MMRRRTTQPVRNGVGASAVTLPNEGPWLTVLDFLVARFPAIGASEWRARFDGGLILNAQGEPLDAGHLFAPQARIHYYRDLAVEVPVPFDAPILFQDEFLVVADKPHFLSVMPAGRYVQETLLVRLRRATGIDSLAPMHRIDRDTAGLVVFIVRPETRGAYQSLFHTRQVEKHYEAIAPLSTGANSPSGQPLEWPLTFRAKLRESENFMQVEVTPGEANSESEIALAEADPASGLGRYRLRPVTGKKHQLRAHMSALGIPILNDPIYPHYQPAAGDDFSRPLQLLAKSIRFEDPVSGGVRHFESARRLVFPDSALPSVSG
jgi:tRNA pseudouridine32 synthase/23S rRNA pseudouridine746 synthase